MCHPQWLAHSRWFTKEELQYSLSMAVMSQSGVQWCKMFFCTIIYFKPLVNCQEIYSPSIQNLSPLASWGRSGHWSLCHMPTSPSMFSSTFWASVSKDGGCIFSSHLQGLFRSIFYVVIFALFLDNWKTCLFPTSCWECWKALLVWLPTVPTQPPQATKDCCVGFPGKCFNP